MPDPSLLFFRRLAGLAGFLILAAAVCVGLAMAVAHNARATFEQITEVEIKAEPLAHQFRAAVDDLNGVLARFGSRPADETTVALRQRRDRLNRWIADRTAAAHTPEEIDLLNQISDRARDFLQQVDRLEALSHGYTVPLGSDAVASIYRAERQLEGLVDDFAAAHDARTSDLLAASLGSVRRLRTLVFGCLGLLAVATGVVGMVFYRDLVRPLRVRLMERERQLAQREKLAALGTLAAGVAHEIRNPLTAIKARLYMLRRPASPAEISEDVQAIAGEIDHLDLIVQEVLGYARPGDPSLEVVELTAWLRGLARFIEPGVATGQIELVVKVCAPVEVLADPAQLKQIVLNLARNAQEALTGRGGRIELSVDRERIELHGRQVETAVIGVTDDGPGVPADIQPRLFDPFFTTKAEGTGLGLSTVARLVDQHGGAIVFRTGSGSGTKFAVHLPARDPASPPKAI